MNPFPKLMSVHFSSFHTSQNPLPGILKYDYSKAGEIFIANMQQGIKDALTRFVCLLR